MVPAQNGRNNSRMAKRLLWRGTARHSNRTVRIDGDEHAGGGMAEYSKNELKEVFLWPEGSGEKVRTRIRRASWLPDLWAWRHPSWEWSWPVRCLSSSICSHWFRRFPRSSSSKIPMSTWRRSCTHLTGSCSPGLPVRTERRFALDSVSVHVVEALVATEDYRFFDHWGIDLFRLFSAAAKTVLGDRQGGSTITQQLARNLYVQVGNEISIKRKLKEAMTALQLERNYTKTEILEMYLNTVPFGYNSFGIETASQTYFGKSAIDLDLGRKCYSWLVSSRVRRSIILAVIPSVPSRDEISSSRRWSGMAISMPRRPPWSRLIHWRLSFRLLTHTDNLAPHFAERVRLWLRDWAKETDQKHLYGRAGRLHDTGLQIPEDGRAGRIPSIGRIAGRRWRWLESGTVTRLGRDRVWRLRQDQGEGRLRAVRSVLGCESADVLNDMIRERHPTFKEALSGMVARLSEALAWVERTWNVFRFTEGPTRHASKRGYWSWIPCPVTWKPGLEAGTTKSTSTITLLWPDGRRVRHSNRSLYTAAIDNGYSPYYRLLDDSVTIELPGAQEPWKPKNSHGSYSRTDDDASRGPRRVRST